VVSPPFLRGFTNGFRQGLARLGTDTAPGGDQGLGIMCQAIQPRRGQERIAKAVGPLGGGPVTGGEDAARLVALVNDVIEIRGRGIDQGFQPEVVQDEQPRPQSPAQTFRPCAIRPAAMEMLQQLVGVDEEHVIALPARFMGERLGEMARAHAGRPADQHVAFPADVLAAGQVGAPVGG
jgi:hypothetical protein